MWQRLLPVVIDIYHHNKTKIPKRLHPSIKSLKHVYALQICTGSPYTFCHIGTPTVSSLGSPYAVSSHLNLVTPDVENLHKRLCVLVSEWKLIFKEMHACLRQPAREVCTFMLNNKDRMHAEYIPNCAPIACVMKGKSLPIDTLQYLVNKCHDELHTRNISILCEIYDGQWRNIVNQDCEGNPLTKIQPSKKFWDIIGKLSKQHILEEII